MPFMSSGVPQRSSGNPVGDLLIAGLVGIHQGRCSYPLPCRPGGNGRLIWMPLPAQSLLSALVSWDMPALEAA